MKQVFLSLLVFIVLFGCIGQTKINTSSDEKYRKSINSILESLDDSEKDKFFDGVACIMFDGKEKKIPEEVLLELYIRSGSPWYGAEFRERFNRLHGLTAEDVIEKGKVIRTEYDRKENEKRVKYLQKEISDLEDKKATAEDWNRLIKLEKETLKSVLIKGVTGIKKERSQNTPEYDRYIKYTRYADITNNGFMTISSLKFEYECVITNSGRYYNKYNRQEEVTDISIEPGETQRIPYYTKTDGWKNNVWDASLGVPTVVELKTFELQEFKKRNPNLFGFLNFGPSFSSWQEKMLVEYTNELKTLTKEPN